MKIHQSNITSNNYFSSNIRLKEGDIIKAKIISHGNNKVTIDLGNNDYIKAIIEVPIEKLLNKELNFLIKYINDEKILLSIIDDGNLNELNHKLHNIGNCGNDNNVKKIIIENLMKNGLEIDNNVDEIIKYFNKLEYISNIKENELFVSVHNNVDLLNNDIKNLIKIEYNSTENNSSISNINENLNEIISELVVNNSNEELISKLVFLSKYDIKVSINNLKILDKFENELSLNHNINDLINKLYDENSIDYNDDMELNNLFESSRIETIIEEKNISQLNNNLNNIFNFIKEKMIPSNDSLNNSFSNLSEKISFINQLNENIFFQYIPLNLPNSDDNVLVLKNKKRNHKKDSAKVFISVNTKNLKKIEVTCDLSSNNLSVNIKVEENSLVNFIEDNKSILQNDLIELGFNKVDIKVCEYNEKTKLTNLDNEKKTYKLGLDVRV